MEHRICRASMKDVKHYARHFRLADRIECVASYGCEPKEAATRSIKLSDAAYAVYVGKDLACLFGFKRNSALDTAASVWLLCTKLVDKHPVHFIRAVIEELPKYGAKYTRVENYVDARNTRMLRAMPLMGFTIEEAKPFGLLGRPFHRVWRNI